MVIMQYNAEASEESKKESYFSVEGEERKDKSLIR